MTKPRRRLRVPDLGEPSHGCSSLTARGKPCQAPAIKGSRWCYTHHPALNRQRRAAHRQGGRKRAYGPGEPIEVKDLEGVRTQLCKLLGAVWQMDNTAARARCVVAICSELRSTLTEGELEKRIAALERLLAEHPERMDPSLVPTEGEPIPVDLRSG